MLHHNKYTCDQCGQKFENNEDLIEHARSIHHHPIVKCHNCGKEFIHEKDRLHHVKEEHDIRADIALINGSIRMIKKLRKNKLMSIRETLVTIFEFCIHCLIMEIINFNIFSWLTFYSQTHKKGSFFNFIT